MFVPYDFIKDNLVVDVASATVSYFGYYHPTTVQKSGGVVDTSKAQFLIMKQTKDGSGNITKIQWASRTYDKIWNDRASLTYL
jgi:hypothetical protein